jgi:hypothetical protein
MVFMCFTYSCRSWGSFPKDKYKGGVKLRQWVAEMSARAGGQPVSPEAVHLLERLLQINPAKRIDALVAFQVR